MPHTVTLSSFWSVISSPTLTSKMVQIEEDSIWFSIFWQLETQPLQTLKEFIDILQAAVPDVSISLFASMDNTAIMCAYHDFIFCIL